MGVKRLLQKFSRNSSQIIIYRFPAGDYSAGVYSTKSPKKISVWASVQPVQTDFHQDVLEARGSLSRTTGAIKIFSEEEILTDNQSRNQRADRVEVDGLMYEARSQGSYRHLNLGHFETICVRVADL